MLLLIALSILVCIAVKAYSNATKHGITLFIALENNQKLTKADFKPWVEGMQKCIRKRILSTYMGTSLSLIYTKLHSIIPEKWESTLPIDRLHTVIGILTMSVLMFVIAEYVNQFKKIHFLNDHPDCVKLTYEDAIAMDFEDISKPIDKICAYLFLYIGLLLGAICEMTP